MKIFITGVEGQLGYDAAKEALTRGYEVVGSDRAEKSSNPSLRYISLDLTDKEATVKVLREEKPDAVIHCAAWTAVDDAEDPGNYDKVMGINEEATKTLAALSKELDSKIVYISTDYVFGGQGEEPWEPDFKEFAPLNVYGISKLRGEKAVEDHTNKFFVVRISWVFGIYGNNFVKTMRNVGRKAEEVRVVMDQIGLPTYTFDLAKLLLDMIETEEYGYYHATNEGEYISWYDLTKEIYKVLDMDTTVIPVTTEEYGLSKAERPYNSRLTLGKLAEKGFKPLPHWKDALQRYLKELE